MIIYNAKKMRLFKLAIKIPKLFITISCGFFLLSGRGSPYLFTLVYQYTIARSGL
jgi:hypothetical protein